MTKSFHLLAMLLISMLASAQKQDLRTILPFSKVAVTDGLEVNYTTGSTFAIVVEGRDDKAVSNIETSVRDNTLHISRKNPGLPVKVLITAPSLKRINATSKAKFNIHNEITAPKITINVSKGASVTGMVTTDRLTVSASGKSTLNLIVSAQDVEGRFSDRSVANIFGTVSQATFTTEGGAVCNARKLEANKITINASDDSAIFIEGSGKLNLNVSQNGTVAYTGKPEMLKITTAANFR